MFFNKPHIVFLFLLQVLHLIQSAAVLPSPHWNRLPFNSFGCPQGKVADVVLFLDTSHHLSKVQFDKQIQRAEHMVRLFRNFNERQYHNRIAIVAISDSTVKHIVKFKSSINSSKKSHTEEFVHILRKLHQNKEMASIRETQNRKEMLALKQLKRLSSQMRKEVAHIAFYFSADEKASKKDLKRAKFIRRLGIYLYIFRLGPSQITYDQYKKLVHKPVSDFVFAMESYSDIDASVKKLLDMEHCNMQISPPEGNVKSICVAKRPVNLLLGIDQISLNGGKTKKILSLVENIANELKKTNGAKILIEEIYNEMKLNSSEMIPDYNSLLEKINKTIFSSLLLNKVEKESAQNTVILFLHSNNQETKEMIKKAKYIKDQKTEIYAIVLGKKRTFSSLVSKPTDEHLFQVENEKQFITDKEEILKHICKGW